MMKMLSNDEARELFHSARVVRLGCIVNGGPYVVPINCHLEGDYLYSHSLPGMKISALRENPRACVQVDEIESDLRPATQLDVGTAPVQAQSAVVAVRREVWRWFVWVALAVLVVEWLVFTRRMHL